LQELAAKRSSGNAGTMGSAKKVFSEQLVDDLSTALEVF
jgi:hypothetical protein